MNRSDNIEGGKVLSKLMIFVIFIILLSGFLLPSSIFISIQKVIGVEITDKTCCDAIPNRDCPVSGWDCVVSVQGACYYRPIEGGRIQGKWWHCVKPRANPEPGDENRLGGCECQPMQGTEQNT